jgi:hypothetical protein
LIGQIIGIAEDPKVPKRKRLEEGLAFASRFIADRPNLAEFVKDDLLAAAISGRHAPDSEWLLAEVRGRLFEGGPQ